MSELAAELRRIWDERGALTPHLVVEAAANFGSPLHSRFEWDDTEAAVQYRLIQAGGLIREAKLKVTHETRKGDQTFVVREWVPGAYVGSDSPPGGYVPTAKLDSTQRRLLLSRMEREVRAMKLRYGHLSEFWEALDAMREHANV